MPTPIVLFQPGADSTPPSQVGALSLLVKGSNFVQFEWPAATDNVAVTGYEILIDGVPTDAGNVTQTTVSNLLPETEYFFQVRAYDGAGNRGTWSPIFSVTTDEAVTQMQALMLFGDVAADGTIPSGAADPYQPMRLNDSSNEGFSTFSTTVNALSNLVLTEQYDVDFDPLTDLDQYHIIFLCSSQRVWTTAEIDAFEAWVKAGGRLIALSDSALGGNFSQVGPQNTVGQTARLPLTERFGMQPYVDQAGGVKTYTLPAGSELGNTTDLQFRHEGSSPVRIDVNATTAQGNPRSIVDFSGTPAHPQNITYTGDISALAIATPEAGFFLWVADRNSFFNGQIGTSINEVDNLAYAEQIFRFARDYRHNGYLRKSAEEGHIDLVTPQRVIRLPDFTYAGMEGGIEDSSGWNETTVQSGTGDDAQAIKDAIAAAVAARPNSTTGVVVRIPDGTWNLNSEITLTDDYVVVKGQSVANTILNVNGAHNGFRFLGSRNGGRRTLTVDHDKGSFWIDFSGTSGFSLAPGDFTELEVDKLPPEFFDKFLPFGNDFNNANFFDGEFARNIFRIEEVNGNLVRLHTPTTVKFDVSGSGQEIEFEGLTVVRRSGVENLTIDYPTNVGGQWSPFEFEGGFECHVKDCVIIRPQSHPFGFQRPGAKQCEIRNCTSGEPWNVAAGGNGYSGFFGAYDCLMDGCDFIAPRHGPNLQSFASGCVIRNCYFEDTNGENHTDFARRYLIELCHINKLSHPQSHIFKTKWLHNTPDGHDPSGGEDILWNNLMTANDGGGVSFGGLNYNAVLAYNRIVIDGQGGFNVKPNLVQIFDYCDQLCIFGNKMWDKVQDSSFVHEFVRFVPGFQPLFGQTGIGNWDQYPNNVNQYADPSPGSSAPINQTADIHIWDNEVYGPSVKYEGFNTPVTDENNTVVTGNPPGNVIPDVDPPFESLYQAMIDLRAENPQLWAA